jgi:hypothetical protein
MLIERALVQDCGAEVALDYRPAGLTCTIELPLPEGGAG